MPETPPKADIVTLPGVDLVTNEIVKDSVAVVSSTGGFAATMMDTSPPGRSRDLITILSRLVI